MWYMNEEREMLQKMVREFAETDVRAFVKEMEENDTYPTKLIKKAGDLGILGLVYPEEVGGSGGTHVDLGIALEELGKVSTTFGLCALLSASLATGTLYELGTPEQKENILKPILAGDAVLAGATTEPVGINNWYAFKTKAVLDGDEWVLNGGKIFITNAGQADWYYVYAITNEPDIEKTSGCSLILVHKDTPGFRIGHIENKLGWHGSSTGQIYFKDCRIPKDQVLGPVDMGYAMSGVATLNAEVYLGIIALGGAEGVYEKAYHYCKERMHPTGSLFDSYQVVRHQLAQMWEQIESLRCMAYATLDLLDQGKNALSHSIATKVMGARVFESVASQAVHLFGGNGTIKENDIERYYRDAKMFSIGGGALSSMEDSLSHFI